MRLDRSHAILSDMALHVDGNIEIPSFPPIIVESQRALMIDRQEVEGFLRGT